MMRAPTQAIDDVPAQEQTIARRGTRGRIPSGEGRGARPAGPRARSEPRHLSRFDADQSQAASTPECRQLRASLVAEASRALWLFVVQREACGLRDLRYVLRDYRVPHEVAARMGALPREPHTPKRDP